MFRDMFYYTASRLQRIREGHTLTGTNVMQTKDRVSKRWSIRIYPRTDAMDGLGQSILADIRQLPLSHIEAVRTSRIYLLRGNITATDAQQLATNLFADPVSERFEIAENFTDRTDRTDPTDVIEVQSLPGVMDPVALSAEQAIRRLLEHTNDNVAPTVEVRTARRYQILGAKNADELERIASHNLANSCMEKWYIQAPGRADVLPEDFPTPPTLPFELRHVSLLKLDDTQLTKLSREGHLFLSLEEMKTIQAFYQDLNREPTDLELETLAQTWSEHCVHKTLKSAIDYEGDDFGKPGQVRVSFDNLLKETIVKATTDLDRDWCLSVFVDNAGVIAFDDFWGIAFKAETHNHPSAIEPYGGAATGTGGCIRDVMGCGLGAKPIASTDVFCLAPPDFDASKLPKDVIHPRRVLKGVVGGVRDYGNRMGIPTVNGAIYFDERYLANPLVFCGCVGLIPRKFIDKAPRPGDKIVVAGGRTGRDGIHGATFSSAELTDTHADEFSHAVQIGNAIEEKKLLDAQLLARDHADGCLYSSITDCGAGGLSSAVGEMGEQTGADVELKNVPLKYSGLRYDEIWISEAQERMVYSVPPENIDKFLALFAQEDVEATVIGDFTDDKKLRVRYDDTIVCELDMAFLHDGLPKAIRKAKWTASESQAKPSTPNQKSSGNDQLLAALSEWSTASKEWVIRQYDHEVQGRSVIKPLAGPLSGPSDAAVLRPIYTSKQGIALGCGLCPQLGDDPYWMAIYAIDEALRNIICVGANPNRTAILDNFCWPKVDTEHSMGTLVRACRGAYDAAMVYGLPFISGKDSLNNEFTMSDAESARTGLPKSIAIPPTLLISALGIVDDTARCITMDLKSAGNVIAIASADIRQNDLDSAFQLHKKVASLIAEGKIVAAHDVSDGGLAVALAEMCIASGLGITANVSTEHYAHELFDEPSTTYALEMTEKDALEAGLPVIGHIIKDSNFVLTNEGTEVLNLSIDKLAHAWRTPLSQGGGQS